MKAFDWWSNYLDWMGRGVVSRRSVKNGLQNGLKNTTFEQISLEVSSGVTASAGTLNFG